MRLLSRAAVTAAVVRCGFQVRLSRLRLSGAAVNVTGGRGVGCQVWLSRPAVDVTVAADGGGCQVKAADPPATRRNF